MMQIRPLRTGLLIIILVCFVLTVKVFALPATTSKVINGPATVGYGTVNGGNYSDAAAADGVFYSFMEGDTSNKYLDIRFHSWQQLDPSIDVNTVTKINLVLTGKVDKLDDTFYIYLWDYVQSTWVLVGAGLGMDTSVLTQTVSVTSNVTNYINNGYIRVEIKCSGLAEKLTNAL